MSVAARFRPLPPDEFDVNRPSIARINDYLLYGKDNFAADRAVADQLEAVGAEPRRAAEANRAFVCRAVRAVARRGVTQFLDLGSGLPASPSVDEVAREVSRHARVAYVDYDPMVVAHNEAMLAMPGSVAAIRGDLRYPRTVAGAAEMTGCIDFGQPVAVLLTAVLHFIGDEENPSGILKTLRDMLAPGSHMILAAATDDGADPGIVCTARSAYEPTLMPFTPRTREQIRRFFDGFELLRPGVVAPPDWRPGKSADRAPLKTPALCGVGQLRK
jgi:hypothetical protein